MSTTPDAIHGISQNQPYTSPPQYTDRPPLTVRIVSEETPAGFLVINAADFDPATMTEFQDLPASAR